MAAVQKIAKRVRGRGGGLESVQSMALAHGKGIIEVACAICWIRVKWVMMRLNKKLSGLLGRRVWLWERDIILIFRRANLLRIT
ncbi:hypothetical protein CASFOL_031419 [Castilleja foliolosa]|uniref:Uncharacterized protein n=1 Tax=Castilleja foliolosa TaxID=1961234 RepID=A0ABD3C5Y4_9LAMI